MHLLSIAGWLSGCSHRRKTFPFTPRSTVSANHQSGTPAETYIVCLDCGRKLAYDWNQMLPLQLMHYRQLLRDGPRRERGPLPPRRSTASLPQ